MNETYLIRSATAPETIVAAVARRVQTRVVDGVPQFAASELGGAPEFDVAIDFSQAVGFDAILRLTRTAPAWSVLKISHPNAFNFSSVSRCGKPQKLAWPQEMTQARGFTLSRKARELELRLP